MSIVGIISVGLWILAVLVSVSFGVVTMIKTKKIKKTAKKGKGKGGKY